MKKLLALLLALCLLPMSALAEMNEGGDVVVTLEGAALSFTPIENGYCITRESSASVFNRLGMSQRDVLPYMEEYDVYAMLYDAEQLTEVQLSAISTMETDFDALDEQSAALMCESFQIYYASLGYDVASVVMYQAPEGHKYVCSTMSYTYEDGYVEGMVEYLTCQAGYSVSIVVFPYEGLPAQTHTAIGNAIADSLRIVPTAAAQ